MQQLLFLFSYCRVSCSEGEKRKAPDKSLSSGPPLTKKTALSNYRGYYMAARRDEISLRVEKKNHESAQCSQNIFNTRREISYLRCYI